MSITVRTWTEEDLLKIRKGTDLWLSTVFMNASTFGEEEIQAYPYNQRKSYHVYLKGQCYPLTIYATDKANAIRFIEAEYNTKQYPIVEMFEMTVAYIKQEKEVK